MTSINFKEEWNIPRGILWKEFCDVCFKHSNIYLKPQEFR